MSFHEQVALRCGRLRVQVDEAELPLSDLCGYASRRSRKRGFVFVSKVLGKHYPVRPCVMADTHARLAAKLAGLRGPVLLIALAETATGLGQGIYEQWLRQTGRADAVFLHTTRYRLHRPPALDFEESHSHATQHLLYEPADPEHRELFRRAATLVLVDDEISTGNTLANLAAAYRRLNGRVAAVEVVSLTDWLTLAHRAAVAERAGLPVRFHSLLRGGFTLEEDGSFDPGPIPDVTGRGDFKDSYLPSNFGRLGVQGVLRFDLDASARRLDLRPGQRLLVLGTGEFAYPPYLLARHLEERGWDVFYQSTTRSPLLIDTDVSSVLEFEDNYHDGIANYVYNVAGRRYDHILIGYETPTLPALHRLPQVVGGEAVFF